MVEQDGPLPTAICGWTNVLAAKTLNDVNCVLCLRIIAKLAESERARQAVVPRDRKGRAFDAVLEPPEPVTEYGSEAVAETAPSFIDPVNGLPVLTPETWRQLRSTCNCGMCNACRLRNLVQEAAEDKPKPTPARQHERSLDFRDADEAMHWWADLVQEQLPGRGVMSWASNLHGVEKAERQAHERHGDHRRWSLALLTVGKGHVNSGETETLEVAVRRVRFEETLHRLYPKGKDWQIGWAACVDILLGRVVGELRDTPLGLRRVPALAGDIGRPWGLSAKRVGAIVRYGRGSFMQEYRSLVRERKEAGEKWREGKHGRRDDERRTGG